MRPLFACVKRIMGDDSVTHSFYCDYISQFVGIILYDLIIHFMITKSQGIVYYYQTDMVSHILIWFQHRHRCVRTYTQMT